MKIVICDKVSRILKNKKKIEEVLEIKISNKGKEFSIEGSPESEYVAEQVIEALNYGFPFETALSLNDEAILEIVNIKDYTPKKDYPRIRARIIGKNGKTLKTLSNLTNCNFELKNNFIAIIGEPEFIKNGQEAIISIVKGTSQSNVYAYLEKRQVKPIYDLGLKEEKKSKNAKAKI